MGREILPKLIAKGQSVRLSARLNMFRALSEFLFPVVSVVFWSDYSLEESIKRLQAASVPPVYSARLDQKAVGSVTRERVELCRFVPRSEPRFVGSFQQDERGVVLSGCFGARKGTKIYWALWFGFGSFWTVLVTLSALVSRGGVEWWWPFSGAGIISGGVFTLKLRQWFTRGDMAWLSQAISQTLTEQSEVANQPPGKTDWLKSKFTDFIG